MLGVSALAHQPSTSHFARFLALASTFACADCVYAALQASRTPTGPPPKRSRNRKSAVVAPGHVTGVRVPGLVRGDGCEVQGADRDRPTLGPGLGVRINR
jgi:hypothetical protein